MKLILTKKNATVNTNALEKSIKAIIKRKEEELNNKLKNVGYSLAQKCFAEANNMYQSFIDQYYSSYDPLYYIRHMYRGTSNGLYDSNNISFSGGHNKPAVHIRIDASNMLDDYQRHSAAEVLEGVMNGIRGVPPYWTMSWSMDYSGTGFTYSGSSIYDAFRLFKLKWEEKRDKEFVKALN